MDGWQKAQTIAAIVQTLVVVVSLYFIWRQVQQQTKQVTQQTDLARIANVQSLVGLSSPFNLQLITDPDMARLWVEGAEKFESYDEINKFRYRQLLTWWLILHENIFYQRQKNLLDTDIYKAWSRDLEFFIEKHRLDRHWTELEAAFQTEFCIYVEKLIKEAKIENGNEPELSLSSDANLNTTGHRHLKK
jgi:hypothetical protein